MTKEARSATLVASDGVPIAYRVHGSAASAPVVALVHSLGMDHGFWNPVAQRLGADATVIAIDARGHGRSGVGITPFSAERMALDLREVLDEAGVDRAVVGGASMGGCVALQFAGSYPTRTVGL